MLPLVAPSVVYPAEVPRIMVLVQRPRRTMQQETLLGGLQGSAAVPSVKQCSVVPVALNWKSVNLDGSTIMGLPHQQQPRLVGDNPMHLEALRVSLSFWKQG